MLDHDGVKLAQRHLVEEHDSTMTPDLGITLVLLATAVVMFALNRPRMDAVALLMMTVLPFTGVIDLKAALAGFSDPNIVLIAALFVIGEGLVRTGVAQRLGDWLMLRAALSERRFVALLMLVVAAIGSVMSSTAVTAIFIPVVLRIARTHGIAVGRLMMPLCFAALFSGMMTLIGTPPNLVVNSELVRRGHDGFHLLSITPFGLSLLALGILYMLVARRWLGKSAQASVSDRRPKLSEWIEKYGLATRAHRLRITERSPLIGKTLGEIDLRGSAGVNIIAIERKGRFADRLIRPEASTQLLLGDVLFIDLFATSMDIEALRRRFDLEELPLVGAYFSDHSQEIGMVEVMIPPDSTFIGKTVLEAKIRTQYGLTVVGMRRAGVFYDQRLLEEKIQFGDTLLLVGRWKQIRRLQSGGRDVIVLDVPVEIDDIAPARARAPHALFSLAVMITLMVTGIVPNVLAALIGCLLMGLTRCIDLDSAYRSIHWQSIVLIVGMLPFSFALQKTGGVDIAANALLGMVGEASPRMILAALFIATAAMGLFISNTATAVLMAPIALTISESMQSSPYPFAMIVSLAASCAFMTPVSSPVNTLIVGPGNYRFSDFVKVGVPFTLLALIISVVLVPWLLPL
jgi:di/tricarboxylate transporter